jgi:hypothetical protein
MTATRVLLFTDSEGYGGDERALGHLTAGMHGAC